MFTRLYIHNFKAIGPNPVDIELKPLTIFVGPNGSGKSSILEALALAAQSATEDPEHHNLVLSGSKIDFHAPEDINYLDKYKNIYFARDMEKPLSIGVGIDISDLYSSQTLPNTKNEPNAFYKWTRKGKKWTTWNHYLNVGLLNLFHFWRTLEKSSEHSATTKDWGEATGVKTVQMNSHLDRVLSRGLFLLDVVQLYSLSTDDHRDQILPFIRNIHERFHGHFSDTCFLSTLRGSKSMHTEVGPEVSFVGKHGEYTIRFLSSIQAKTTPIFSKLKRWANEFNLSEIEPGWAGGKTLKIAFSDRVTRTNLDLFDASSGSIQGLMMATQLLLTKKGSTILIEEPENNLHPAFEKLLPQLFSDSISSGHQIIASTHSEVLIAALGNTVRSGILNSNQLAIYHLERDINGARAEKIDISDKGYLDNWVKSFASVEKELFDEWYKELPKERKKSDRGHTHSSGRRKIRKKQKKK